MRLLAPSIVIVIPVLLLACGKDKDRRLEVADPAASTPEDTYRASMQSAIDDDQATFWNLASDRMRHEIDTMVASVRSEPALQQKLGITAGELHGLSTSEAFVAIARTPTSRLARPRISHLPAIDRVDTAGDRSTVHFTLDGDACSIELVRENSAWKIDRVVSCRE